MRSAPAPVRPVSPPRLRRVAIVEDHTAVLEMMKAAVEGLAGYKVIGYASDFSAGRELCRREQPDVVVLDLVLAPGSGLALLAELREVCPRARAVIFSGNLRAGSIRAALLSGAHGLVEKTASLGEFEHAIRSVGSGQVYFSRFASEVIRKMVNRGPAAAFPVVRLTERDKEVLRGIAEGLTSKEISARLGIGIQAVVNRRSRLSRKTGLRGVARLSRYAVHIGLIEDWVEGAAEAV